MKLSFPPIPNKERLVQDGARFPSLEPGNPHRISRVSKPSDYPERGQVPDDWEPGYRPKTYTHPKVLESPSWAEAADYQVALRIRAAQAGVNPETLSQDEIASLYPSYEGSIIAQGRPRNPRGPTGLSGQGLLGKHGENTAADPVLFRRLWDKDNGLSRLQMVAIRRADNGMWAIPGGMTDFGEMVSETLARELREEALGEGLSDSRKKQFDLGLQALFEEKGIEVYAGAVDDERNTDTSWMATKVYMLEITSEDANRLGWDLALQGGDDATDAQWMDVSADNLVKLNANHGDFVAKSVQLWQENSGLVVSKDSIIGTRAD